MALSKLKKMIVEDLDGDEEEDEMENEKKVPTINELLDNLYAK